MSAERKAAGQAPARVLARHRVSGRREGTRNAGTRDAIIDDRDALLQAGRTLMTCPYGVFGNHWVLRRDRLGGPIRKWAQVA